MSEKDWSPRFEQTFFTCSIISRSKHSTPLDATDAKIQTHHHPVQYFNVKVKCGKKEEMVAKRYSQFRSLYDEIRRHPPESLEIDISTTPLHMPPKTCFFSKLDEDFLDDRQEELGIFLDHLLKRPNYSKHPAVRKFLRLDEFAAD